MTVTVDPKVGTGSSQTDHAFLFDTGDNTIMDLKEKILTIEARKCLQSTIMFYVVLC